MVSLTSSEHLNKSLFTWHLIYQGTMGVFRKLRVHIKITIKLTVSQLTIKNPAFNSMSRSSTHNLSVP